MKPIIKEIIEWLICIIIAVILALIVRYYIGTPTIVSQQSMSPTLEPNQRLWLNRWGRTIKKMPQRGEIITFEAPSEIKISIKEQDKFIAKYNSKKTKMIDKFIYNVLEIGKKSFIKRVIGLPGEYVEIKDGFVYIDGKKLQEDYLQENTITEMIQRR